MKKKSDGSFEGVRMQPFTYTDRLVVGVKAYNAALQAERLKVKPLEGQWGAIGDGYEERYQEIWQVELKKAVDKKWCCVTDIMDHMITETSKVYEDTEYADNFVIFHDGLAAYWEKEAQDHLKDRGFNNRQLRAYSPTNDDNRYYKNRVVGDSPELCPSLDYSGFNDHHLSMNFHCALSVEYPRDDLRAIRMATPDEVERTMVRCWMMEPSSERICQDINLFPSTLQMIIVVQGCVLKDIDLRRGRRRDRVLNDPAYQKLKGEGQCKNKPRPRSAC